MTKVDTCRLEGASLDWAVAQAVGEPVEVNEYNQLEQTDRFLCCGGVGHPIWEPSECWSQGGPLIAIHRVSIIYSDDKCDPCAWTDETAAWGASSPLIAAMRAIVANKLGSTVEVPTELAGIHQ